MANRYQDPTANAAIARIDREIRQAAGIRIRLEETGSISPRQRRQLERLTRVPSRAVSAAVEAAWEAHLRGKRRARPD